MSSEVTAVITTHVRPASAREALASVCAETHPALEVIVVDDGGAFELPAHDVARPVRVLRGNSLGVARARNLGLSAARGEYVIFLDDDDVALPHRIERLVDEARRRRAALCFGRTRRVVAGTGRLLDSVPTNAVCGPVDFCELLDCAPHVNAVLARTDALRAAGGFDAGAAHFDDWSAWLRMSDRGDSMWSIAETVAEWRIHGDGLSGRVLEGRAMKARLLALFAQLASELTRENARAVDAAREVVECEEIVTYDDYANAMAAVREALSA